MYYDDEADSDYEAEVMGGSAKELEAAVIGHRIVEVRKGYDYEQYWDKSQAHSDSGITLVLDNGTEVAVHDTDDCCAYTSVRDFEFLTKTDNVITRVETNEGFDQWHIYAAEVPVVSLGVDWSPGNPYYYGFGFGIAVKKKENN